MERKIAPVTTYIPSASCRWTPPNSNARKNRVTCERLGKCKYVKLEKRASLALRWSLNYKYNLSVGR